VLFRRITLSAFLAEPEPDRAYMGEEMPVVRALAEGAPTNNDTQALPPVIGVDLGGTQIRTAVLRGAKLLSRVASLTGEDTAPEHMIPRIFNAVQQALDQAQTTLDQVAGIGIAAPGPLDNRTGTIYAPPNIPRWDRVPLRDIFEKHFSPVGDASQKISIFVENDANAAGLGEYMFGAGRGCLHMVYLTISTGIGGGVIVDGKIVEGAHGMAGELGHMTIDLHAGRCRCGNYGCLEYLASGTAMARYAHEAIAAGQGAELLEFARALQHTGSPVSPADEATEHEYANHPGDVESVRITAHIVSQAAEAGIPLARTIITNAAEAIGVGLVNVIHIFNPELIILGGGITQMGPMLMEPALRIVQERAMKMPRDAVRILLAESGANVGLVGAGALVYYYARHGRP
jgi:glucokinase